jgi:hypothetical protein
VFNEKDYEYDDDDDDKEEVEDNDDDAKRVARAQPGPKMGTKNSNTRT